MRQRPEGESKTTLNLYNNLLLKPCFFFTDISNAYDPLYQLLFMVFAIYLLVLNLFR